MALVFPGGPAGVFDVTRSTRHWNCAGDEITVEIPPLLENTLVRLNTTAVGEAIHIAASHVDKAVVWQWCVVNKKGAQHVYHATAAQATNGTGGGRIEGVKSVYQWLGTVCRTPHTRRARSPETSPLDRVRAMHGQIVELVCERTMTQVSSGGVNVSRGRVLNLWDDALDAFEALRTLDENAPSRTDRRPTPRETQ